MAGSIHQFTPPVDFDYKVRVRHLEAPDSSIIRLIGENPAVGTTFEDITEMGGIYPFPIAAETLDIVSDNVNDTLLGTGGRTLIIFGLDGSFEPVISAINMNGTTTVTTTETYMRVHQAIVFTDGVYGGRNIGTISVTNTTTGDELLVVLPDKGTDNLGIYTTAVGKQANIIGGYIVAESNKPVEFTINVRGQADLVVAPFGGSFSANPVVGLEGSLVFPDLVGRTLPQRSDVWVSAKAASGTAAVTVVLDILVTDFIVGAG